MAGVVSFSSYTPGRKQWNIKDKKSVRRFRNQLAEDGCPESQLVLAKQLLQEKSVLNTSNNDENARLGVFWLIKASEQGNVEATNILKSCLESGEGITEHNYLDVKACLSTSQNEKLAKRAAHEMFISLSAGQDFITSEQLRRRMKKIDLCEAVNKTNIKSDSIPENNCLQPDGILNNSCGDGAFNYEPDYEYSDDSLDWSAKENFGEKLTEDHLENAAVTYSRGELPLVQHVLTLTDPKSREIQNLNYLQRTILHPLETVHQSYLKLLDHFSSRYGNRSLNLSPSSSFLQILLILIVYPLMLHSRREYSNFRIWSRLFLSYDRDGNLNTDDAEFEYCKKNLRPFIVYFVSLLINLVAYPFVSELWIPQSEFAITSFALTFTTLYYFHEKVCTKKVDYLMLFSFGVNVLAKYPYETDGVVRQTWRFLDIELPTLQSYGFPCFASRIVGNCVEFCLNFHGFFYVLMPAIFIKIASRENWKGTYKVLIPHCVTLSWWQIAVLCCQGATLYGLIRSTLALVGLIFFLPLVGIVTVFLPIIAVLQHFTDITLTPKTGVTTILAAIPVILAYVIDKKRGVHLGSCLSKIQIFLAVISVFFLVCPTVNQYISDGTAESEMQVQPIFTWDQYSSLCRNTVWNKRTAADIQRDCIHFHGVTVNWEGVVEDVRIVRVHNNFLKVVNNLPQSLRSKLICLYGEQYEENCSTVLDVGKIDLCQTIKQLHPKNKCHVRSWDKYDFQIKLRMKTNAWKDADSVILLEADDNLRNFSIHLRMKDHIWFSGSLNFPETIGSEQLQISVDEIGCISCENNNLTSLRRPISKFTSENILKYIDNGFKRILNFIFNPVLIFR